MKATIIVEERLLHRLEIAVNEGEEVADIDPDDPRITDHIGDHTVIGCDEREIIKVESISDDRGEPLAPT